MNVCYQFKPSIVSTQNGFSLIELIVVIILLSILSVTILPKFFSSNGFEEFTYQAEVITKLRNVQLRAMQQTDSIECHKVLVTSKNLGIPVDCDVTLTDEQHGAIGGEVGTTHVQIAGDHDVEFDVSDGDYSFDFDGMGRPSCNPCEITILAETDLVVVIESEGYIHAK